MHSDFFRENTLWIWRKKGNITLEKTDKHCPSQVIKINIHSFKFMLITCSLDMWWKWPLWSSSSKPTTSVLSCEKKIKQIPVEGQSTNYQYSSRGSGSSKPKGNCHSQEEPKETWQLNVVSWLHSWNRKRIRSKNGNLNIMSVLGR